MAYSVVLAILLLLPFPLSTKAQTYSNLTLGSSLPTNDQNSSWLSPSGEFTFGFRKIGTRNYLLAVWFDKIDEKTIIWSANGNNLAAEGSKVQLTADGRLVLTDPKGKELWAPRLTGTGIAYATMLDTGNFILANQDHVNLWETFSQPADTIMPTQALSQGSTVNARYLEKNYSAGRFHFILQADGNLVFYTTPTLLDYTDAYWSSETIGSGFQLVFNQSGQVCLTARYETVLNILTSGTVPTSGFYQRVILEYDGVFRQYVHPKTANSSPGWPMGWSMVSSPVPPNICTSILRVTGIGACGFNSYCTLGDDQRLRCQCPPGYTLLDPTNEMNGCRQDFVTQSCEGSQPETDLFTMRDLSNTDWPLSDYEYNQPQTEDWCRQDCLADCFCAVAIFRDKNCRKKRIPLSNGKMDRSVGGKALIKVRIDNSSSKFPGDGQKKLKNSTLIIIVALCV